jgi:hypothetical protein
MIARCERAIRPLHWPSSVVSEPVERGHSELSEDFAPWEVGMQPEAAADAECTQPASTDVSTTIEMSFCMDGLLRFQCPNFVSSLEHRTALATQSL